MSPDTLRPIYGDEPGQLAAQRQRYAQAERRFVECFGPGPAIFLRTPGRLNLIGEHTDYNGGFVMPVALDKDVLLCVRPRPDATVHAVNVEGRFAPFCFSLSSDIARAPSGDWSNYFRGAAQEIYRRFDPNAQIRGMDVLVSGMPPHGVPRGAGLSSSTALTVAAALALATVNEISVERADLAHLCSEAEWYVGTRGGMMDQFAALLSRRHHALFLDCRPSPEGVYRFMHVPIPDGVQVVLLTSGVWHDNVRGEFNQRVAECKIGVQLLKKRYPGVVQLRDVTPEVLGLSKDDLEAWLQEVLPLRATAAELIQRGVDRTWLDALIANHNLTADGTFTVLPRCRHVIAENVRVLAGVEALRHGDVESFGGLMDVAHKSMSHDYGASCQEVDVLVEIVRQQSGVLGARITGAGWGGGVVALVRRGDAHGWMGHVCQEYKQATGMDAEVFICQPGDGAGRVTI